jgi:hypothetical protein
MKLPAFVFPALLFAWMCFFEGTKPVHAFRRVVPALMATAATAYLVRVMTPRNYSGGASSAYAYIITQPDILRTYFIQFFLPVGLSADTDHHAFATIFSFDAMNGFLFPGLLIAATVWCAKRIEFPARGSGKRSPHVLPLRWPFRLAFRGARLSFSNASYRRGLI